MKKVDNVPEPQLRELRNFGLLLGATIALVFGLVPRWRGRPLSAWPFLATLMLWIVAITFPSRLRIVHTIWSRLGAMLGWLNSRLVLIVAYVLWVVPLGLLMRSFGRDPLKRRFEAGLESYRIPSRGRTRASMEKPY